MNATNVSTVPTEMFGRLMHDLQLDSASAMVLSITLSSEFHGYMQLLCAEYSGGDWMWVDLPNGGFYLSWCTDKDALHCVSMNGSQCDTSPDAASIVACLTAFSHFSFVVPEIGRYFHLLRNHVCAVGGNGNSHPEIQSILELID